MRFVVGAPENDTQRCTELVACDAAGRLQPIFHHLFVHKTHRPTHWRQNTRQWNRATWSTQYANCWPAQSVQLLSNICNKIN